MSYDYLPLLDEMDYVPVNHYSRGPEIFGHCQAIARKYNLYDLAVFSTTVTETSGMRRRNCGTSKLIEGMICVRGLSFALMALGKPKLSLIDGMDTFKGMPFIPLVGIMSTRVSISKT